MSNAEFKGVRGGNPEMRPFKIVAKVPCKSCGRTMTTKIVFGAMVSQHDCSYCVSQKPARVKCQECGSNEGKTYLRYAKSPVYLHPGKFYFHKPCLFKLRITQEVKKELAEERYYA